MVRTYIPKKKNISHNESDMKRAVKLVEDGKTVYAAAKECGVPYETLRRWIRNGAPSKFGSGSARAAMSTNEEEIIVESLEQCGKLGWPVGVEEVRQMIKTYLDSIGRKTSFVSNLPSKDWCIGFKKRWSERIRQKKPEVLTKSRSKNLSEENLCHFFQLVEREYQTMGMFEADDAAERIYNLDETGCSTDASGRKLFFSKSARDAYLLSPNCGKATYTVLFAGNAAGEYLAPLVVYKGKNMYESWTLNGPDNCQFACTDSGWMSDTVFENWFRDYFVAAVSGKKKPVVVFFDGHGSHLTFNTVKRAREEQIVIICIPPHTSHALQPLDVAVFGPLKARWREILLRFYRETYMDTVSKAIFPSLLKQLCSKLLPNNIIGGFRGAGLWPFNPDAVRREKIIDVNEENSCSQGSAQDTPRKLLRVAIVQAIAPALSECNKKALENSKKKRKRVQATHGEVLTSDQTVERLRQEAESRKKTSSSKVRKPSAAKRLLQEQESETDSEEEEDVQCKFCPRWWSSYKGKKGEQWLQCDLCDNYVCPKCIPDDIDFDDDYYCKECTDY